ncbi:hypothetical protein RPHASCH2410_PB00300 (plasmid) [Rhizobium phaseoli Ch24-10]|nr:hypothetical protein RPHASCH2410_PB00300 [Rhizobium phaseoli Ch24-10]
MDERRLFAHRLQHGSRSGLALHSAPFRRGRRGGGVYGDPRATPSAGIIRFRFEGFFSARLSTNAPVSHHALFRREGRGCHPENDIPRSLRQNWLNASQRSSTQIMQIRRNRGPDRKLRKPHRQSTPLRCTGGRADLVSVGNREGR